MRDTYLVCAQKNHNGADVSLTVILNPLGGLKPESRPPLEVHGAVKVDCVTEWLPLLRELLSTVVVVESATCLTT